MVYAAARGSITALLTSGCTTAADHPYVFPCGAGDLLGAEIQAARELGLRFQAARGSMDLGESQGGLPPDFAVETTETALTGTERAIDAHHDPAPGAMVRISVAPCSPFTVTEELLRGAAGLAPPARGPDAYAQRGDRRGGAVLHGQVRRHADRVPRLPRLDRQRRSGSRTACTSMRPRSSGWVRPAPASRTARPPTRGSAPGSPRFRNSGGGRPRRSRRGRHRLQRERPARPGNPRRAAVRPGPSRPGRADRAPGAVRRDHGRGRCLGRARARIRIHRAGQARRPGRVADRRCPALDHRQPGRGARPGRPAPADAAARQSAAPSPTAIWPAPTRTPSPAKPPPSPAASTPAPDSGRPGEPAP